MLEKLIVPRKFVPNVKIIVPRKFIPNVNIIPKNNLDNEKYIRTMVMIKKLIKNFLFSG